MLGGQRKLEKGSTIEMIGANIANALDHIMYGMTSSTVMKRPIPGHLEID